MTILFSIITVCFNEKDKIENTIKSIAAQTCKDFEWIVIDGASTDGTKDILEENKNLISTFISEKDSGIYNAMNKGIRAAKGKYYLFLNGGDALYAPDTLQVAKQNLEKINLAPDIFYGEMINEKDGSYIRRLKDKKIDFDFFANAFTIHHQASFIKAELFNILGLYSENYRIVSDYEWWLRYFLKTEAINIAYNDQKIALFNTGGISFDPKNYMRLQKEVIRALMTNYAHNYRNKNVFLVELYYRLYKRYLFDKTYKLLIFLGIKDQVRDFYRKYIQKKPEYKPEAE